MSDLEITKQNLYELQAFIFEYEELDKKEESDKKYVFKENQEIYLKVLKLLARNKGLDFIAEQLNNPDITFQETIKQWNPVLTFLISDALSATEPDRKHRLFLKKITEMTGYEYREYLKYLKEENVV